MNFVVATPRFLLLSAGIGFIGSKNVSPNRSCHRRPFAEVDGVEMIGNELIGRAMNVRGRPGVHTLSDIDNHPLVYDQSH